MDYKTSIDSKRSSISDASSTSGDVIRNAYKGDSRRSSIISNLSLHNYNDVPEADRGELLNLQNQKNHLRILKGLEKLRKAKSAAVKQSGYLIHNPDPIAKKMVCDGKNFAFKEFKGEEDSKILAQLSQYAGSTIRSFAIQHQERVTAFARTYNCVFIDAQGEPSLGYRSVKSEHKHKHGRH